MYAITIYNKLYVIGVTPTLSLKDGLLSYEMAGDKFNETTKYETNIKFVCSYEPLAKPIKLSVSMNAARSIHLFKYTTLVSVLQIECCAEFRLGPFL